MSRFVRAILLALLLIAPILAAPSRADAAWGDAQVTNLTYSNGNVCYSQGYQHVNAYVYVNVAASYKFTVVMYPYDNQNAAIWNQTAFPLSLPTGPRSGPVNGYPFYHNMNWLPGSQYGTFSNLPANQRVAPYPGRPTNLVYIVHKQTPTGYEHVGSFFTQFGMVDC